MKQDHYQSFMAGLSRMPHVLARMGFKGLRKGQDQAVRCIMQGQDILAILPTATGKSACFIVPTLCMEWKTIVIYPLISLMRDQAIKMQKEFGISAASISSAESDIHNATALRDWATGKLQIMLVSPERVSNAEWREVVTRFPPDFVAMDEAHTFGNWADTFRPGYKFAGDFIRQVNPKVVAAFTATCPEDTEKEVRAGLGIVEAKLVYHYPRRENLHLFSLHHDKIDDAYPFVSSECPGPTIVYRSTRKGVEEGASIMQATTRREVLTYHGGMKNNDRKWAQDKFVNASDVIMFATNAFGMGVDKPNIRNIVHFDIPGTLVALTQEIGRAGRDGLDSNCHILNTVKARATQRHFIRVGNPDETDIRAFIKAAKSMREGRNGVITAKRDAIAQKANVDVMMVKSIMAFCHGELLVVDDKEAARAAKLRFIPGITSLSDADARIRDGLRMVGKEEDGWVNFNVDALAEQVDREAATVMSRLNQMNARGVVEWIRSSSTRPLRIHRDIDEIDFTRLNQKAAEAHQNLQYVMDYCDTADDMKHEFLEKHLNRS